MDSSRERTPRLKWPGCPQHLPRASGGPPNALECEEVAAGPLTWPPPARRRSPCLWPGGSRASRLFQLHSRSTKTRPCSGRPAGLPECRAPFPRSSSGTPGEHARGTRQGRRRGGGQSTLLLPRLPPPTRSGPCTTRRDAPASSASSTLRSVRSRLTGRCRGTAEAGHLGVLPVDTLRLPANAGQGGLWARCHLWSKNRSGACR